MINVTDYKSAERVFYYFEEISKIPHGSGNTAKIADYIEKFAMSCGLDYTRDLSNTLIIKKSATKGYENHPTVILQGHTDMVLAKDSGIKKDLLTEGVDIYRDGDLIKARGTTLGADDGIAIAYMLALLESNIIPHPPIEAVFTSDEETGLCGAKAIEKGSLSGKTMLNLDMDIEGTFTAGCAGGVCVKLSKSIKRDGVSGEAVQISVNGLRGGHSGAEIGDGRENAIKILAELLDLLGKSIPVRIYSISGGNAENAIPKDAEAIILADEKQSYAISSCAKSVSEAYKDREPEIRITVKKHENIDSAFTSEDSASIISLIHDEPSGVIAMSNDIDGLVETSLNLGTVVCNDDKVAIDILVRSSKEKEKYALVERVEKIANEHGAVSIREGDYPGWEYKKTSTLRPLACEVYRELYGKDAKVTVIHAGLECGIFTSKVENLDCISLGPDIFDIHTTAERLSISSAARVWGYILTLLSRL